LFGIFSSFSIYDPHNALAAIMRYAYTKKGVSVFLFLLLAQFVVQKKSTYYFENPQFSYLWTASNTLEFPLTTTKFANVKYPSVGLLFTMLDKYLISYNPIDKTLSKIGTTIHSTKLG
jgi:hypothetical protein